MDKLLVMCPSRNRPDRIREMLSSFDATKSPGTSMAVYVSDDDPQLDKYRAILEERGILHVGPRKCIVEVFNFLSSEVYPGFEYYGEVNDDHFYVTKGWDQILIQRIKENGGWGISSGNDWKGMRHPSACVISGNIVRTLGHFIHPSFQHLFVDDYLRDIGDGIGKLMFDPGVSIEHRHWANGTVGWDDTYRWVYSDEQWAVGRKAYKEWSESFRNDEINKIKEAMLVK